MKKLFMLFSIVLIGFTALIVSPGQVLAAAGDPISNYVFDSYSNTLNGLTLTIDSGTNLFTVDGTATAMSTFGFPTLYTANVNGSVLSTTDCYAVIYEYISGTATNLTTVTIESIGSTLYSTTYSGSTIALNMSNYMNDNGFIVQPNDATKHTSAFGTGSSFTNLKFKIHYILLTNDLQSDVPMFDTFSAVTENGITATVLDADTIVLTGSPTADVSADISALVTDSLLNNDALYMFSFEYMSGSFNGTGYPLNPIIFEDGTSTSQFNISTATQGTPRGLAKTDISSSSVGTMLAATYTSYTYKIHVQEISLYEPQPMSTIYYNDLVDGNIATVQAPTGQLLVAPTVPVKAGYTFLYWETEANTVWNFASDLVPADELILYAVFVLDETITHTITFNTNGGSAIDTLTVEENTVAVAPTAPTKSGYTFTGWYADIALTNVFSFIATPINEDLVLYAKWLSDSGTPVDTVDDTSGISTVEYVGFSVVGLALTALIFLPKKKKVFKK